MQYPLPAKDVAAKAAESAASAAQAAATSTAQQVGMMKREGNKMGVKYTMR